MKHKLLLSTIVAMNLIATNVFAMTIIPVIAENQSITAVVTTDFGLSGTIDSYQSAQSLIVIKGVKYTIADKGSLTDADLYQGREVLFNVDKSSTEEIGYITKIWLKED